MIGLVIVTRLAYEVVETRSGQVGGVGLAPGQAAGSDRVSPMLPAVPVFGLELAGIIYGDQRQESETP